MDCPACQSNELSDETDFASSESHACFPDWEPGLLQWKALTLRAERARICLDCGYLLLFVGAKGIAKLKAGRSKV